MGEQNHWGAWQASEEEVRLTFSTGAETVCGAVTKGYLQPALIGSGLSPIGPRGGKIICWYDISELTARPDKTEPAMKLYDRMEISPTALRREAGFDESDAPTPDELADMTWKKVAGTTELAPTAVTELSGQTPAVGVAPAPAASGEVAPSPEVPATPTVGLPATRAVPPPSPAVAPPVTASSARPRRYNGVHAKR